MQELSLPKAYKGRIQRLEVNSKMFDPRIVDVWLPESYDGYEPHAVVYMHDGQMLFDPTIAWNGTSWGVDEVLSGLIAQDQIHRCIVVGIWNQGASRHSDYFPQKPFDAMAEQDQNLLLRTQRDDGTPLFTNKIQSDNYLKFIVKELKPLIDASFVTHTDQQHTFIGGSSMGGLVSVYALCEYTEVFGGAMCLSTHWLGSFQVKSNTFPLFMMEYLSRRMPKAGTHKIYFDHGTDNLDGYYKPYQSEVDAIMQQKGYTAEDCFSREFDGADHSEVSWKARLHLPFLFVMGKQAFTEPNSFGGPQSWFERLMKKLFFGLMKV